MNTYELCEESSNNEARDAEKTIKTFFTPYLILHQSEQTLNMLLIRSKKRMTETIHIF